MAMTRAAFTNYFVRGLKEVFWTHYKELDSVYEKIFNVETSQKNYEEYLSMVGFGYLAQTGEMETATLQDALEGYKTRATHLKYSLGYKLSSELIDDDMYNQVREFPAALARSARATQEKTAADIFNLGFSGGTALADGKQLFATDHVLKRGGTLANRPSSGVDLSFAALRDAATAINKYTDDSGLPIAGSQEITLLVPPDLEFDAAEIIKSVDRPDVADRATNALAKQRRWNLLVWNYLSDTDAWILLFPKAQHGLKWINRKEIDQENDYLVLDNAWVHVARYRSVAVAVDFRGIYASPGL